MFFAICFAILWLPIHLLFPTKVIGKKNLPKKKGVVLTCNHYSNMDCILIDIYLNKKVRFLAKKELFKNKIFAWMLKKYGACPVDREKPDMASFKFALNTLKQNKLLGIFPEGTRNKLNDELQEFKNGAIVFASKADTQIVPMVLYRRSRIFRKNYLIIGEPIEVEAENKKKLKAEETDLNTQRLVSAMNKLRVDMDLKLQSKKQKKEKLSKEDSLFNSAVRKLDEFLDDDEGIRKVYQPKKSSVMALNFWKAYFPVLLIYGVAIALLFIPISAPLETKQIIIWLSVMTGIVAVIFVLFALAMHSSYNYTLYCVTNKRVLVSGGVLDISVKSIPLEEIRELSVHGKNKIGSVYFESEDLKSILIFKKVQQPNIVAQEINEMIEKKAS